MVDLRVIGVLLLIPLLDVMLLVTLATPVGPIDIGPVATVALVVLTALVGLLLVRAEGRHTLSRIRRKLAGGEAPTDELLDGGLLIAAAAFLLTPGLVTDLVGLLLVLPPTRYPIRALIKRYVVVPYADAKAGGMISGAAYTGGFPGGAGGGGGERREVDLEDSEYSFEDRDRAED
jgi:UPF0716 protein FxsA